MSFAFADVGAAVDLPGPVPTRAIETCSAASCVPGGTTLCLNQSRFQLTVDWEVPAQARSGHGTAVPMTSDTGYFWFLEAGNVELVVKVLAAVSTATSGSSTALCRTSGIG